MPHDLDLPPRIPVSNEGWLVGIFGIPESRNVSEFWCWRLHPAWGVDPTHGGYFPAPNFSNQEAGGWLHILASGVPRKSWPFCLEVCGSIDIWYTPKNERLEAKNWWFGSMFCLFRLGPCLGFSRLFSGVYINSFKEGVQVSKEYGYRKCFGNGEGSRKFLLHRAFIQVRCKHFTPLKITMLHLKLTQSSEPNHHWVGNVNFPRCSWFAHLLIKLGVHFHSWLYFLLRLVSVSSALALVSNLGRCFLVASTLGCLGRWVVMSSGWGGWFLVKQGRLVQIWNSPIWYQNFNEFQCPIGNWGLSGWCKEKNSHILKDWMQKAWSFYRFAVALDGEIYAKIWMWRLRYQRTPWVVWRVIFDPKALFLSPKECFDGDFCRQHEGPWYAFVRDWSIRRFSNSMTKSYQIQMKSLLASCAWR